ncbi:MAG TPA: histidine kinase dimerization/phosphoacceptor domain -containing protein [Spirochaetota bacterium]|nr:histidine kinase dimerization/phosphoacceptor domain -containing protein [Spirochaetota bacterium]HPS87377.1 histidine kinase dimerization/phosphoacceptor domain -containing protein [Spirochaetota bacterium]
MKKLKIIIISAVLISSGFLIYSFRFSSANENFFTHFFYIPIILTAFWWQYRVIPVILFLVVMLLGADFLSGKSFLIVQDLIRTVCFFTVGITVSYLRSLQGNQLNLKIYRDILYSIQEAVVIIDKSFNIILTNDSFKRIFNPSLLDISNIHSLLNNDLKMKEFQENALRSFCGESVFMGVYLQVDNSEGNYYLVSFYPLKSESGINNLILSFRNISEQKRMDAIQKRASERQRISIDVLELINRKNTDSDLINNILALIRGKTGIDALVINLKTGDQYYKFASISLLENLKGPESNIIIESDSADVKSHVIPGFDESFCRDIAGDSIFWTNNLAEYCKDSMEKFAGSPVLENFLSCAIIPLKNENDVTGYFMLLDRREDFFNEELIVFYQWIVESIEIALNRIQYELNLKNIIHEKELLLKEVHHRVKNNMQVIISLISLQASRQKDDKLREILNECQNRVRTMALVHEKLYSSDNFTSININAYIKSLVPMLMTSYRIDKTKINVEIDALDTYFDLNIAIPLAQLVNEILSNVFKHAFVNSGGGNVKISLTPDIVVKNRYVIKISDNGTGLPPAVEYPHGGNLGFQLIDALAKQIKSKISLTSENGVTVEVAFTDN